MMMIRRPIMWGKSEPKGTDNSDSPVPITKDTRPSDTKPKGKGDEGKTKEERGGK